MYSVVPGVWQVNPSERVGVKLSNKLLCIGVSYYGEGQKSVARLINNMDGRWLTDVTHEKADLNLQV